MAAAKRSCKRSSKGRCTTSAAKKNSGGCVRDRKSKRCRADKRRSKKAPKKASKKASKKAACPAPKNAYWAALTKAREAGAKSFTYKGNKYERSKAKTGLVVYKKASC